MLLGASWNDRRGGKKTSSYGKWKQPSNKRATEDFPPAILSSEILMLWHQGSESTSNGELASRNGASE